MLTLDSCSWSVNFKPDALGVHAMVNDPTYIDLVAVCWRQRKDEECTVKVVVDWRRQYSVVTEETAVEGRRRL